ncbi:uncharacterized protein LOC143022089 isoform X1 [Oratosquilla oratoria]|uniref:uncharacterized protein LOC143022089 isoform X1 n=1 Tax=Oratosquilla oratoria TaxID=337810 RepID=UPI003F7608C3
MPEEVVLVTGVSGFIGSHVAKLLLEDGYKVRGTVRSLENTAKVDALKALVPDAKHELELVEADLSKEEGWDSSIQGCTVVMHVDDPFLNGPEIEVEVEVDEQEPADAKEEMVRVLKKLQESSVKKIIVMSSSAAVVAETTPEADKVYTEEDWSDPESATIDPYSKSKVLAEKAAWDFVKELPEEEKIELCVINPAFVLGPALLESHKGATSMNFMTQVMNRAYPAVPRISFAICDVRDVAKAHVQALKNPAAAGHRHIICTDTLWLREMTTTISKEFRPQGYSVPTGQLPYVLCWIAAAFNRSMKSFILPRIGKQFKFENKRMVEVLGVEPTAVESTLHDMVYSLVDLGILRKAKKYKQVGSRAEIPSVNGEVEDTPEKEGEEEKKEEEGEKKELEPEDKEEKKENEPEEKAEEKKEEKTEDNKEKEKEEAQEEKKEEKEPEK